MTRYKQTNEIVKYKRQTIIINSYSNRKEEYEVSIRIGRHIRIVGSGSSRSEVLGLGKSYINNKING